jgi:solute carrier family 25 (peroxisomal adenine nucleotide transporter), member 17
MNDNASTTTTTPMKILITLLNDKSTNFYQGISAYYLLCLKPALQYTIYEKIKQMMVLPRRNKSLSPGESFLVGMIARTIATVLIYPFLRVKVLMQADIISKTKQSRPSNDNSTVSLSSSSSSSTSSSVVALLRQLYARHGYRGLYQGIGPELTRGIFSAALMLMIKEQIANVVQSALVSPSSTTPSYK